MGARAGHPPADRVPVVSRGNAAGSGGAGEPTHGARIPGCARVGAGLPFRVVRAGVLPGPEGRPGPAGGTVDRVGSDRWRSGGPGGGRGRVWGERLPHEGASPVGGPEGDRGGGRTPPPAGPD